MAWKKYEKKTIQGTISTASEPSGRSPEISTRAFFGNKEGGKKSQKNGELSTKKLDGTGTKKTNGWTWI